MSRYIPDSTLDLIINDIAAADEVSVCSNQPATYYNACHPAVIWVAQTDYAEGDLIRPPTGNGFIYECTVPGTSDISEPPWGTAQDETFNDNGISWKTHANYALVNAPLTADDKIIEDHEPDGRRLRVLQKMGILVHTEGDVTHTALIDNSSKALKFVTVSQTSLAGDNLVVAGRTTLIHELNVIVRDPSAV